MNNIGRLGVIFLFLASCSGLEKSEQKKVRKANIISTPLTEVEPISCTIPPPKNLPPPPYPWNHKWIGTHRRITKEFFRCKGSYTHPPLEKKDGRQKEVKWYDCNGISEHSLPIREGKEFIYPILIKLLNYLQEATQKKVVITCGHRCPRHNTYAAPPSGEKHSKHQIGAEVDFYIEGMEWNPEEVAALLLTYYEGKETPLTAKRSNRTWTNKEVKLALHRAEEKRDGDNAHPYPYLTLEVLYDTKKREKVHYSYFQAYKNYFKH